MCPKKRSGPQTTGSLQKSSSHPDSQISAHLGSRDDICMLMAPTNVKDSKTTSTAAKLSQCAHLSGYTDASRMASMPLIECLSSLQPSHRLFLNAPTWLDLTSLAIHDVLRVRETSPSRLRQEKKSKYEKISALPLRGCSLAPPNMGCSITT